jgi:hypothetical protein
LENEKDGSKLRDDCSSLVEARRNSPQEVKDKMKIRAMETISRGEVLAEILYVERREEAPGNGKRVYKKILAIVEVDEESMSGISSLSTAEEQPLPYIPGELYDVFSKVMEEKGVIFEDIVSINFIKNHGRNVVLIKEGFGIKLPTPDSTTSTGPAAGSVGALRVMLPNLACPPGTHPEPLIGGGELCVPD